VQKNSFSVYIHLPFCADRCLYCDFFSTRVTGSIPYDNYVESLGREWQYRKYHAGERDMGTLYIGGGTPSLWPAHQLGRILSFFELSDEMEITVEANPGDARADWFYALADLGVNRYSVGVQALDDDRLCALSRRHDKDQAKRAVTMALESGARSVGADIIYGTDGHSLGELSMELNTLINLGVHHVSAYELTGNPRTPLGREIEKGSYRLPGDDEMVALWFCVGDTLGSNGFRRYEVSNYSLPGFESRHNQHYWRGGMYLGLGAGAHGFIVHSDSTMNRYTNVQNVKTYMQLPEGSPSISPFHGIGGGSDFETISPVTYARERMMLGLRTEEGSSFNDIISRYVPELEPKWNRIAGELEDSGMVRRSRGRLYPTTVGMLHADGVAQQFF
jgi:putative oxygen-independent coproporphyrinogen III oxidase